MGIMEMSDAQINLAIAKIEYPKQADMLRVFTGESVVIHYQNDDFKDRDYCKNWSDIGPIIERERIDVVTLGIYEWLAMRGEQAKAETPTKAALCFLKMKGVEV